MNQIKRIFVWLRRLPYCRGFGIQSPTDYAFVRYVINEHYPYYAYDYLNHQEGNWLNHKLGRLYFRLANWRQPSNMKKDDYASYWQCGCKNVCLSGQLEAAELVRVDINDYSESFLQQFYPLVDDQSVLVIEGIWKNWALWHRIQADLRVRVTFDLYYCGIVLFDSKRQRQHYIVNF